MRAWSLAVIVVAGAWMSVHRGPASSQNRLESEVHRVQRHIAAAEKRLSEGSVEGLSATQREHRAQHQARLASYRRRGIFPHNHEHPGGRVPVFVDRHGTLCAVGYLIASTGAGDIVEAVRTRLNNGTVAEIAADPDLGPILVAWLAANGLTVDEAGAIQPAYDGNPGVVNPVTTAYGVGSVAAGLMGTASSVVNLAEWGAPTQRFSGWLGLVAGGASVALGASELGEGGDLGTVAAVNLGLGVVNALLGVNNLVRSRNGRRPTARAVAPWVSVGPRLGAMGIAIRF